MTGLTFSLVFSSLFILKPIFLLKDKKYKLFNYNNKNYEIKGYEILGISIFLINFLISIIVIGIYQKGDPTNVDNGFPDFPVPSNNLFEFLVRIIILPGKGPKFSDNIKFGAFGYPLIPWNGIVSLGK